MFNIMVNWPRGFDQWQIEFSQASHEILVKAGPLIANEGVEDVNLSLLNNLVHIRETSFGFNQTTIGFYHSNVVW